MALGATRPLVDVGIAQKSAIKLAAEGRYTRAAEVRNILYAAPSASFSQLQA